MKRSAKDTTRTEKASSVSLLTPAVAVTGTIAIYFLAQFIVAAGIAVYANSMGWDNKRLLEWLQSGVLVSFMSYVLVAVIGTGLIYLLLRVCRTTFRAIGVNRPRPVHALYALFAYGCYLPLFFISSIVIGLLIPAVNFEQQQQLGFSLESGAGALAIIAISLVIIPPIYEELLCRGLLFTGLRRRLPLVATALIVSTLFALPHLQFGSGAPLLWAAALDTFILSLILVHLRERTGSLWPAIGLHAIKNFVAFMLLFVFKVG